MTMNAELWPIEVGPQHHERVGQPVDRGPAVGLDAIAPPLGERGARVVEHARGDRRIGDVEAGAEDHRVDLARAAVLADQRPSADLGEPGRQQLDVGACDRGVVVIAQQHPLAPKRVVRR